MDHKSRKDKFKRAKGDVRSTKQYILYVEGRNTEKSYLDLLKKANCKIMPVTVKGHGISQCVDFVNESENAWRTLPQEEKQKYSKRWLVFDADGRADFADGIRLARKKGFGVAFSNMCIEYWFLLHFQDQDGSPIPMIGDSHSKAQIEANVIGEELGRIFSREKREPSVPEIMEAYNKAKKRSNELLGSHPATT